MSDWRIGGVIQQTSFSSVWGALKWDSVVKVWAERTERCSGAGSAGLGRTRGLIGWNGSCQGTLEWVPCAEQSLGWMTQWEVAGIPEALSHVCLEALVRSVAGGDREQGCCGQG